METNRFALLELNDVPAIKIVNKPTTEKVRKQLFGEETGLKIENGRSYRDESGVWHNALGLESTESHSNVAKIWQDQCVSLNDFATQVLFEKGTKSDDLVPEHTVRLSDNIDTTLRLSNGQRITPFALQTLTRLTTIPKAMVDWMVDNKKTVDLSRYMNDDLDVRGLMRAKEGKTDNLLLRKRDARDESGESVVRAILSERYGTADNDLMLDMLARAIPGDGLKDCLASHIFDNGDDMYGNVLVPDYVKTRPDSEYGIGIAFRNSEVSRFSYSVSPYLFRAYCLNGLCYGRRDSNINVSKKHLGEINVDELFNKVKFSVETSLSEGQNLLNIMDMSRDIKVNDVARMIVSLGKNNKLQHGQIKTWLESFNVEPHMSVFGVVNALTRAARGCAGETRIDMESLAGSILTPDLNVDMNGLSKYWNRAIAASENLEDKTLLQYVCLN